MAKVECLAGHPVETQVAGETYKFTRDQHGRFVADVDDIRHVQILTAVVHYRVVADDPAAEEPPKKAAKPKAPRAPKPAKVTEPPKPDETEQPDPGVGDNAGDAPGLGDDPEAEEQANDDPADDEQDGTDSHEPGNEAADESDEGDAVSDSVAEIDGVGPALQKKLAAVGITTLKQIAALDDEAAAKLDADLKLKGRIARDGWVEQAKALIPDEEE